MFSDEELNKIQGYCLYYCRGYGRDIMSEKIKFRKNNNPILTEDNLELNLTSDNLNIRQEVTLEVLEAVLFHCKGRYLFGSKEIKPLFKINPNKIKQVHYDKIVKKVFEVLK
jgi:hypothetical protein